MHVNESPFGKSFGCTVIFKQCAWTRAGECHVSYGTYSIDANVTFKPDHILGCLGL